MRFHHMCHEVSASSIRAGVNLEETSKEPQNWGPEMLWAARLQIQILSIPRIILKEISIQLVGNHFCNFKNILSKGLLLIESLNPVE